MAYKNDSRCKKKKKKQKRVDKKPPKRRLCKISIKWNVIDGPYLPLCLSMQKQRRLERTILSSIRHRTMQHELFRFSNVRRAARVAASKTSSTPSPVKDEHSRYFLAPIWVDISPPSLGVTNRSDFFLISSIARGSSRRSFFKPTNMIGTPGHRSFASSIHYNRFSQT